MSLESFEPKKTSQTGAEKPRNKRRNVLIAYAFEAILLVVLLVGIISAVVSTAADHDFGTILPIIVVAIEFLAVVYAIVLVMKGQIEKAFWRYFIIFLGSGVVFNALNLILQVPRTGAVTERAGGVFAFVMTTVIAVYTLEKRERNRAIAISFGVGVFNYILTVLRPAVTMDVGSEDLAFINIILYGALLVSLILIGLAVPKGIRMFRRSTGFKLGVGFAVTTLITLGFMAFAITILTRVGTDFDYARYADLEQITSNDLAKEVRGMRIHVEEYLRNYRVEGLDEAYTNYMVEYSDHKTNATNITEEFKNLLTNGWGYYIPGESASDDLESLLGVETSLTSFFSLVDEIVDLTYQRGDKHTGLEGELRQVTHSLENAAVVQQNPELKVLILDMLRYEKSWDINQDMDDADQVNILAAKAVSLMKSLDIPTSNRLEVERNLNTYVDVFNRLVETDAQIAEKVEDIEQTFRPMNKTIGAIAQDATVKVEDAQQNLVNTEVFVRNAAIAFGIGAVLVAGLVAYLTTRTVVRPIASLTTTASSLAEGQLEVRSDVKTQDETGTLAQVFNQMADRLQDTLAGLEAKVAERTAELEERAKEMEASQRVTFAASERTTPEDFLDLLVNLIVDQFDVYHSQIYLVDAHGQNAVLSQSTGYAGRVLLQRNHHIPLERESLVTRCIKTGESVLVANTLEEEGWLSNDLLPMTQSELVVPVKVEGRVIGALDIQDRVAGRFTDETVPVFESMIEQVAFLYQNNELLVNIEAAQMQQQEFVKQLESASEVAGQLTTILDPTQLLDQAVTMLQSRFNFYHAHIYLLDEAKENLVVQAGSGHVGVILKDRGHSIPVNAEKSFVASAFRNAAPVRIAETTQDPNWLPNPLLPDTRSEMAVPLITRGQIIGVLDIQAEEVNRFTDVDQDTMLTLAGQLATSVDTARLFEDVENAAHQTATRLKITEALAGNLTEQEVLDVLVEQAAIYPDARISIYYEDMDAEVRTIEVQRDEPYNTGMNPLGAGYRVTNDALNFENVLLKDQEVVIKNVHTDNRLDEATKNLMKQIGYSSLLTIPMQMNAGWLGFIFVSAKKENCFDNDKVLMYSILAEAATTALRSARLREQTESERERFETLVNYAPDAILMLDYETYMWKDANTNAQVMFGMSHEELMKIGPGDVSPSHQPDGRESGEKAVEMIMNAVEGGDTQFEWVHTNSAGEAFDCDIRLALLPGEDKQLLVNITDITQRKSAQNAIIEGDKLKSEFLANMSHELRTPLNSIVGYTDVLLMGVDGDLNDEMLLDVQAIQENSTLLLNIINDILDLAKIEAKRVIFEISEIEVKDVLENVVRNNAGLLVNKPVEMLVDAAPNLPKIEVDPMRVEQVLNNLVSNAVKFTGEGHITLRAFKEDDWMVMQVEDSGAGISEDDLQMIFEEFRQADGSQTRTVEGTGLGLTITRRLVHMHSGTIEVESELGKGSTFTVRLPIEANINPEVTVKKVAPPKAKETKPAPQPEAKAANSKTKAKGNGSKDLAKAAELFADELKEAVASSAPNAKKPEDSKQSSEKEPTEGKNGSNTK